MILIFQSFLENALEEKSNECIFLTEESNIKLTDAEGKIISLTRELDSIKSELKSNGEKLNLEQKRFSNLNENLREELDQALVQSMFCLIMK